MYKEKNIFNKKIIGSLSFNLKSIQASLNHKDLLIAQLFGFKRYQFQRLSHGIYFNLLKRLSNLI